MGSRTSTPMGVGAAAPWAPRAGAVVVEKNGWIYLLGGEEGFTCDDPRKPCPPYFNDVWRFAPPAGR